MGIQKDKLSDDQKKEIERLRQFVARNRLDARMNGTKWRAAIDAATSLAGYRPAFRVKRITDATEPPPTWDGAFPGNIPLYNSIEWLELNASREFRVTLKQALTAAGIPIEETPNGIRIIGYARSASSGATGKPTGKK